MSFYDLTLIGPFPPFACDQHAVVIYFIQTHINIFVLLLVAFVVYLDWFVVFVFFSSGANWNVSIEKKPNRIRVWRCWFAVCWMFFAMCGGVGVYASILFVLFQCRIDRFEENLLYSICCWTKLELFDNFELVGISVSLIKVSSARVELISRS